MLPKGRDSAASEARVKRVAVGAATREKIITTLQQSVAAITNSTNLDEALVKVLDACSEGIPCLYPTIAILDLQADRLVGYQVSSLRTRADLGRVACSLKLPLDGLLGGERRVKQRTGPSDAFPFDSLCFTLAPPKSPVVRVFVERIPWVTTSLHDMLGPDLDSAAAAAIQQALGIEKVTMVPLVAAGHQLGVLASASGRPAFEASHLSTLELFASHAALVIERDRLLDSLRARERQISSLLRASMDAQEEERERICMEIHDGVAQMLGAAFHYLQALDSRSGLPEDLRSIVRKSATLVRNASREAREVIANLRPAALDTVGLIATLHQEIDDLRTQTGWQVELEADEMRFPKLVETALYRIVQEALTNVAKHAKAKQVTVRVKQVRDCIAAEVQDNGVGFDYHALERQAHNKGLGLLSMRKRAELLQGSFELTSEPQAGTRVSVQLPLSPHNCTQSHGGRVA